MTKKPTDLSDKLLEQILNGIELSSQISEEEKTLIRGEE